MRHKSTAGYMWVRDPSGRRRNDGRGYRREYEHIAVVEKALGHGLPPGAEIHHVDGDRLNNAHSNLVACQDHSYHVLIEKRTRAYRASGHAEWRKCCYCRTWDDPANLKIYATSGAARHNQCQVDYMRRRRAAKRRAEP